MRHIAEIGHGITSDELMRETAMIFGLRRLTEQARVRLDGVLAWAIKSGRLHREGDRIHV